MQVVIEGELLGRKGKALLGKPTPARHAPALAGHAATVPQQQL